MIICKNCGKNVIDLNYMHISESEPIKDKFGTKYKMKKSYNLCNDCYKNHENNNIIDKNE